MVNMRHLISLASRTHGHLSFGTFGDEKMPLVEFRGSSLAAIKRILQSPWPKPVDLSLDSKSTSDVSLE
jgi:hypothetical protein